MRPRLQETLPALGLEADAEQVGQPGTDLLNLRMLSGVGHEHETHAGIVELEVDLLGAQRRVQRDVDGAGNEDRHVGDQPFEPILRQDRDTVARLDAMLHQRGRTCIDLVAVFVPAQIVVEPVLLETQRHARAKPVGLQAKQSRQRDGVHGRVPCRNRAITWGQAFQPGRTRDGRFGQAGKPGPTRKRPQPANS